MAFKWGQTVARAVQTTAHSSMAGRAWERGWEIESTPQPMPPWTHLFAACCKYHFSRQCPGSSQQNALCYCRSHHMLWEWAAAESRILSRCKSAELHWPSIVWWKSMELHQLRIQLRKSTPQTYMSFPASQFMSSSGFRRRAGLFSPSEYLWNYIWCNPLSRDFLGETGLNAWYPLLILGVNGKSYPGHCI